MYHDQARLMPRMQRWLNIKKSIIIVQLEHIKRDMNFPVDSRKAPITIQ